MVGNWLLVGRMMAVSGRFTAIVDRLLGRTTEAPALSAQELAEAVRAATLAEFGEGALEAPGTRDGSPTPDAPDEGAPATAPPSLGPAERHPLAHATFFASLAAGGLLSALLGGQLSLSHGLRGELFAAHFGAGWSAPAVLLAGGLLVGFGTRMASGCTSGHGLCGVSRGERGSLLATAAFFGMGVAVSLLLGGH
jgi:uncharacterized membrane protein YedE/YeeE